MINRRLLLKNLAVSAPLYCGLQKVFAQSSPPYDVLNINSSIPTAGRVGFYIDYSELPNIGTHYFYVARTHGSSGSVSVGYQSFGDQHANVSGTLNWADGEMDIKVVPVEVLSKPSGDHRCYLQLTNPTGGAPLHFGEYTRAYGVIADETIAPESEALFFDADASSNGDGTQGNPYNNIYDAISNIGSKRYLYGKGAVTPDGTNTGHPYSGSSLVKCIDIPSGRSDESDRLYIRNWPGESWTITGNGRKDVFGFFANSGESYHTFRGINFTDLDATDFGSNNDCGGIWYHQRDSKGINVELCNFHGIHGGSGSNNGGANLYGVIGSKVWRCNFSNITTGGQHHNAAGVYSYDGDCISVQRCEFEPSMENGCYHKRTDVNKISMNVKFSIFRDTGILYGTITQAHGGIIISNNYFTGGGGKIVHDTDSDNNLQTDNQINNNYFYEAGSNGDDSCILNYRMNDLILFGNVFHNTFKALVEYNDTAAYPRFIDYNVLHDVTTDNWRIDGTNYRNSATMFSATGFGEHDTYGEPNPIDIANENTILGQSSSAIGASIGGVDAGIYLAGFEKIGSALAIDYSPPPDAGDGSGEGGVCLPPKASIINK